MSNLGILIVTANTRKGKLHPDDCGMEIHPVTEMRDILKRVEELLGSPLIDTSRAKASLLIDGKYGEVFSRKPGNTSSVIFQGTNRSTVTIYLTNMGKAPDPTE